MLTGEVDWCIMDEDIGFNDFLNDIDTILYGRKSYDVWGQYIPGSAASDAERELWGLVDSKKKYVFSKPLAKIDKKAILINANIAQEVIKIKERTG